MICKTVDSLLRQDYSCFEIIVVDDRSNDDTDEDLIDCFGLNQIGILQKQCQLKHKPIVKIWDGIFAVVDCFANRFEFDGCKDYGLTFIGQNSIVYLCINHPCLMVAERILRLIGLSNGILLYVGMFVISMTGMHIASLVLTRTKLRMILGLK